MSIQSALIFLGLFTIAALSCAVLGMIYLSFRIRAAERRERAIPPGPRSLNPELWDGKNALDRAEEASKGVKA